jgi:tyrosine decarboxylase/aspartate 1-decarboxylase
MDENGLSRDVVLKLLRSAQAGDLSYKDGRILGSMCTQPHEFAKEAFSMFIETNLGDSGLFRSTKKLEEEVISSIAELLGLKSAEGLVVTGGTEANIIALWAARNKSKKKKVIMPETAHFSLDKACNLLGLKIDRAKVDEEKRADIKDVESKIDKDTCAIVGVAGSTEYGTVDDIEALSKLAYEEGLFLHIDAAFGGFVLPFLKELGYPTRFDLSNRGIETVTLDPHKMGLVPIPCGCIIFKDPAKMKFIETAAPYLTQKKQHSVVGTRTGASAASAFAVFKHLGKEGYRKIVKECMDNTLYLYRGISEFGFSVRKPTMNILVFKLGKVSYNFLTTKGWQLSTTREGEVRVIVMPHVTKIILDEFLGDLKAAPRG